jgi:3-oxoacyl-[acyl-carrier protein] reductase
MQERRRSALITGVGRPNGIGAAICRMLAGKGVVVCYTWWEPYDRDAPWTAEVGFGTRFASELDEAGGIAHGLEIDLADPTAALQLMRWANERAGEIDILVNNAAVSEMGSIDELDAAMLDRHYAVNIRGMALLTQAFVRQFTQPRGGRIVNLTSGQSLGPMPGELAYAATKGAVEAFTTSAAPDLARKGITVNAVNPGPTDTGWMSADLRQVLERQFPMGRVGAPEDAARLVAFLASEDAEWITGQVIHSEGGFWRQ